jgi:glyoxylase-like metal-dependent hydrolase (beta-lactamase superfamily II)
VLINNRIQPDDISAILYGHTHLDHIGNVARFPKSTALILGPGSNVGEALCRELDVPDDTLEGREVRLLNRDTDQWHDVGCLKGYDFFGDGSLWLLDTPGVSVHNYRRRITVANR